MPWTKFRAFILSVVVKLEPERARTVSDSPSFPCLAAHRNCPEGNFAVDADESPRYSTKKQTLRASVFFGGYDEGGFISAPF